ncbi:MAG TPA: phytanoyl-CoA dioxygenase family protein [Pyrinomonadaceae bacterium]|jgi:ectoine hydroxylase-related dioxygenase (phytanoyl-CoA dioxygenase family)|nr:phytanoyl-CoA dioxygenase family protein [Pyrinomonadaceae bacterium]
MESSAVRIFGVKEQTDVASEVDRHGEAISVTGYTVIPDVLSKDELQAARKRLDEIYQQQVDDAGGEAQLHLINDAHTVRSPLIYDELFLRIAAKPLILSVVEHFLGDYFILMLQNGVLNVPQVGDEQNAGSWHRDLNYQHFVSSRPLSISALVCVDDFTLESGGTFVLPGTHKVEVCPSVEFIAAQAQPIDAVAGSVLVFDSMLYHRGGHNRSAYPRRAINHMYSLPLLKQQLSFPKMLQGRYSDDLFLSRFLGYESEPGENVATWRQARIARLAQTDPSVLS